MGAQEMLFSLHSLISIKRPYIFQKNVLTIKGINGRDVSGSKFNGTVSILGQCSSSRQRRKNELSILDASNLLCKYSLDITFVKKGINLHQSVQVPAGVGACLLLSGKCQRVYRLLLPRRLHH